MKRLTLIPLPLLCIAFSLSACSDKDQKQIFEPETPPPTGDIIVQMNVTGTADQGSIGCEVILDGSYFSHLHSGGYVTLSNVPPGPHTVALVQLPKECAATDGTSKTVHVVRGQTSEVSFSLHCGDASDWGRKH